MLTSTDTAVDNAAAQLAALHSSGALLELERMLDAARQSRVRGLEQLASSTALEDLERMLAEAKSRPAEPDLLGIVGVAGNESVHSNFLAWLLDPAANHGLGDYFLKQFLRATAAQSDAVPAAIAAADWSQASVYREWYALVNGARGFLDILVVNRSAPILCAIENKVFSPESVGQLSHYRKALENDYPGFTRHLVFLSPAGRRSEETTEREVWTPADYKTVHNLVEQTVADNDGRISETARVILQQYAATLRRSIVPELNESAELQQLAREIYLEHREAIELIYRHRPDYVAESKQIFKEAVAQQKGWTLDKEDAFIVRFRSDAWDDFSATRTGTGWKPSQALLTFEFKFHNDKPWLQLVVSPGTDERVREKLLEAALQNPALFRRTANSYFKILHSEAEYILDDSDYGVGWNGDAPRAKIIAWVANFAEQQFPALNEVIVNCLQDYESGQAQQPGQ